MFLTARLRPSRRLLTLSAASVFLMVGCMESSANDEAARIAYEGTPQELREMLQRDPQLCTYRFGRDNGLAHAAAGNRNHPEVIDVLAEFDCDLNAPDQDGREALTFAIDSNIPQTAERLIANGADPLELEWGGESHYDVCKRVVLRDVPDHETCLLIVKQIEKN